MHRLDPRRSRITCVLTLATLALLGWPSAGLAQPTDLFLSEYVEGSSFNKAVEIYNGTGAPVDLGLASYSIEIFFNGSPQAGQTIALSGVVADGDVFVLAHPSAAASILAQADQQDSGVLFNGDDAVLLTRAGEVVDSIGQVGFDPGSRWGTGATTTQDNTLRRRPDVCAGDTNADDPFDPSAEWDGFPQDTFDGLGSHSAMCSAGVDLEALLERIEMLESRVEQLESDLDGHSHIYLTGKGNGHNNTEASTGEAQLPE